MTRPIFAYQRRQTTDDAGNPETWLVPIGEILAPERGPDGLERFPLLRVQDGGRRLLRPAPITRTKQPTRTTEDQHGRG